MSMATPISRLVLAACLVLVLGRAAVAAPAAGSYRGEVELASLTARLARHHSRLTTLAGELAVPDTEADITHDIIAATADAERTLADVDLALRLDSMVTSRTMRETAQTLVFVRLRKSAAHLEALVRDLKALTTAADDSPVLTATRELTETLHRSRLLLITLAE